MTRLGIPATDVTVIVSMGASYGFGHAAGRSVTGLKPRPAPVSLRDALLANTAIITDAWTPSSDMGGLRC